jgi:hypothetical protein
MRIITPNIFRDSFDKIIKKPTIESNILSNWNNSKVYTDLMRNVILPNIASDIDLLYYTHKDYYWLDAIFYEYKDSEHFDKDLTYAKFISIAIEHEHVHGGTQVEINKLQLFNTPLKVLITYLGSNSTEGKLLDKYNNIISDADIFKDFSTHRKQLVIFGRKNKLGNSVDWKYYLYTGNGCNGFVSI